jgi:2-polyprenyl-3-methyl-5-hydroxy-6-metoxy-1,4-benzoquinol methylase
MPWLHFQLCSILLSKVASPHTPKYLFTLSDESPKSFMNSSQHVPKADIEPWPADGLEFLSQCPVCRSSERKLLHEKLRDQVFFCAPGEWTLFQCEKCGSGYLNPRPNPKTIGKAYASYFTHGDASGVERPPRSAWRKYRTAQRNAYLNKRYGYSLRPAAASTSSWLPTERRQRFDKYVCFLPFPGEGARMLDVGCGNGRVMMQLRSVGWQVSGVEPDPKAAAQAVAAGLDVKVGLLEDSLPGTHFDAITMSHVIEHLHDPLETLRRCARVLKPGGVISIATPNFAAAGHKHFGRHWFALDPPRHLVLFTPDSLRLALKASGFEPEPKIQPRQVAQSMFRRSAYIQRKGDPMKGKPRLPLGVRLKVTLLARQANRTVRAHPEQAEELVLLARRVP